MSPPNFWFQQIEIRRMPGFPPPGFSVNDLTPGVNVIYGPNASGKTTLARAIHGLLWPNSSLASSASLAGRLRVGEDPWYLVWDTGRMQRQKAGVDSDAPLLPPIELADRYRLSLHDLLQETNSNREFAEAILRESSGGFDVTEAARQLGFRSTPSRSLQWERAFQNAQDTLRKARDYQEQLYRKEQELAELKAELEKAAQAKHRSEALQHAIEYTKARDTVSQARAALDAFPQQMEKVTGRETQELAERRQRFRDLREKETNTFSEIQAAERELAECRLPSEGIPEELIPAANQALRDLQTREQTLHHKEQELAGANRLREEKLGELDKSIDAEKLAHLDQTGFQELTELARLSEEVRAMQHAEAQFNQWLGKAEPPADLDRRREGIRLLQAWLRETSTPWFSLGRWRLVLALAGAHLAGLSVPLVIWLHWAWLFLGIGGAVLLVVLLIQAHSAGNQLRELRRQDYLKLNLETPETWEPENVEALLHDLNQRLAADLVENERAQRWAERQPQREQRQERQDTWLAKRQAVADRLGFAPDMDEERFVWLVQRLIRWEEADRQVNRLTAEIDTAKAQRDELRERLHNQLKPFGFNSLNQSSDIAGALDNLDQRRQRFQQARQKLAAASERMQDVRRQLQQLDAEIQKPFIELGLQPGDEATLDEWCRGREAYLEAKELWRNAQAQVQNAERLLDQHGEVASRLKAVPTEELHSELEESRRQAERWESLHQEITRRETLIEKAKQDRALEDALAQREHAREALSQQRDQDYAAVTGHLLTEFLQKETRDRDRPQVFHHARRWFAHITRGRYRLEFAENDPPAFQAVDTNSGRGHALSELSSATRVQLLLAVRVAFVETQEQQWNLPLILDETLANSDDARAQSIMEATLTLAQAGRQIFYFTAQEDEVSKWHQLLQDQPEELHRFVNLARIHDPSEPPRAPRTLPPPPERRELPDPNGLSHEAYGRALNPPPLNPHRDIGSVHLWYLVEEVSLLHRLLNRGIETWGQLQTLIRHGGQAALETDAGQYRQIEAAARYLEALARFWRVGRGRPVDRSVLLASGAVTDKFLDEVADKADSLNGDAKQLIAALEDNQVKRFRKDAVERLRVYLEQEGCLDPNPTLNWEEIRTRALAAVAQDIPDGHLPDQTMKRLLETFRDSV